MERLFKFFDRNCDGVVDYNEFLRGVRGEMNDYRKGLVALAFKKLDKTGDNRVTLADLRDAYNVQEHPDVSAASPTSVQVGQEDEDRHPPCHF